MSIRIRRASETRVRTRMSWLNFRDAFQAFKRYHDLPCTRDTTQQLSNSGKQKFRKNHSHDASRFYEIEEALCLGSSSAWMPEEPQQLYMFRPPPCARDLFRRVRAHDARSVWDAMSPAGIAHLPPPVTESARAHSYILRNTLVVVVKHFWLVTFGC